jgi:hypothetical protein
VRVLHLPYNIASQLSVTVRGLRSIGVDARGIFQPVPGDFISSADGIEALPEEPKWPRGFRWAGQHIHRYRKLLGLIAWADLLHWHWDSRVLHGQAALRWARMLGKPGVAEFWGDDIRVAEIEAAENPFYAAHMSPEYLGRQTAQQSVERQLPFARARFACIVSHAGMRRYVREDLFRRIYLVRQRISLEEYHPRPPDPRRSAPVIVHSPSDTGLKGTRFVAAAAEKLARKYDFQFRTVHGVPRREALAILSDADIFVDQVIMGTHGLATLEAMSLAKPVVCFIKPSMVGQYPPELPIVNANPETLEAVLEELLQDGERRHRVGLAGRKYVERYHDARSISQELVRIYSEILQR